MFLPACFKLRKPVKIVYADNMAKLSTKSESIALSLAEEIIRGERSPGERLAQEHIAERFACSHVPVREALQQLVQMELAVFTPRRGVRVVSLTTDDHSEILEMRLALEPVALRHAVARLKPIELKEINDLRQACDTKTDPIGWEKANRDFHLSILRPCGRKRLLQRIEALQRLSAHRFHEQWQERWFRTTDRDHAAIVKAMANRDAKTASQVLTKHLSRR